MATDKNWGIGYNSGLPWDRILEDMKFFREKTMGHPVIMGRKTMESLGDKFPLEGRVNIVLSKTLDGPGDGSYFVEKSVIDAVSTAGNRSGIEFENTEAYVIGGSEIFKSFLPIMSGMFVTIVNGNFKSDTFFNPFSDASLIHGVSSKTLRENNKFEIIYLDFRFDEISRIYYSNKINCIYLSNKNGLVKVIKYDVEDSCKDSSLEVDKNNVTGTMKSKDKECKERDEISVRELKEYFQTPSVVDKYLEEYDSKTVFDIDEMYFYNVGSNVENALLVDDEEVPGYPDIDKEDIRNILKKNKELKDSKQNPKNHTYVGGRVSVKELKKYFGVYSVSYGIGGSPLESTDVIDLRSDIRFYIPGSYIVLSSEEIPGLYEISRDEVSNSIVKNIHRSTYLAEEIIDANGLDELLDSNGSPLSCSDIVDLTENILIKKDLYKKSLSVINRNHSIPEGFGDVYLRVDDINEFMEKFLIEKWDGYSGQNVRTVPVKRTYRVGDIKRAFDIDKIRRKGEFLSEDFIVDFDKYELIVPTNAEIKTGAIVPKGSTAPYLWKSIYDPHLKIEKFLEENKEEEDGTVNGDNPISPSYYESDKIKLRDVLDQNLSRIKDGTLSFYLGNTWKYLWRWDRKENPIQDLKKAKKYIDFAIDRLREIDSEAKM